jgi:hypothetical protein
MKWFLASCLLLLPPSAFSQVPKPAVVAANQVMTFAGLPHRPIGAPNFQCSAGNTITKGVYATWTTDEAGLNACLSGFGEEITPIPEELLPAGPSRPDWFTPGKIKNGSVAARDRRLRGTPEVVRVYADCDNLRIYFFYLWGGRGTGPFARL